MQKKKKKVVAYKWNEVPCCCTKDEILQFPLAWMELGVIMLSEISQKEKEEY